MSLRGDGRLTLIKIAALEQSRQLRGARIVCPGGHNAATRRRRP
jgi:hypothetical protein